MSEAAKKKQPLFEPELYKAILHDSRLTHGAFRLWHKLRDYCHSKPNCWPGVRTLADDLGVSPTSVCSWIKELLECHYVLQREKRIGWRKTSKSYLATKVSQIRPEDKANGVTKTVTESVSKTVAQRNPRERKPTTERVAGATSGVFASLEDFGRYVGELEDKLQLDPNGKGLTDSFIDLHKHDFCQMTPKRTECAYRGFAKHCIGEPEEGTIEA